MINKHEFKKISISEIKPYDRNARTHSTEQVKQIMDAIKEWGFTNPLLIDEQGNLIAGHGRLEAVKQLNKVDFKDEPILELPAIVVKGLSDSQKKALIIADNQIALNAGWDYEVLALELKELESVNYDLDLLAFDNVDDILGEILDNENVSEIEPKIAPAERESMATMNFLLSVEQSELIKDALKKAQGGAFDLSDESNKNKNGNALAFICREFLEANNG